MYRTVFLKISIVSPKSNFRLKNAERPDFAGTSCALKEKTFERRSIRAPTVRPLHFWKKGAGTLFYTHNHTKP